MALASEAELVNVALGKIGIRAWITTLDDPSSEAETGKKFYAHCRDLVLELYDWPFAQKRAILSLLPGVVSGWSFSYSLPVDCLAPREIFSGYRAPAKGQLIPFRIESDGTNRILLTDMEVPELIYTAAITDVTKFPPSFADVVACRLAAELAAPLTGRPDLRKEMMSQFVSALSSAITASSHQEEPDAEPQSEFITVRT